MVWNVLEVSVVPMSGKIGKYPPPRGGYQPMSFGGENMKRGREKEGKCKKGRRGKKKEEMGKKKRKGEVKG
jgi:hypothetical protein